MNNDYAGAFAGIGIAFFIVGIVIYLAVVALVFWVGYLILRTAVKSGILLADAERANRAGGQLPGPGGYGPPPQAPPYPPGQ